MSNIYCAFLPRDAYASADYAVARCLSVHLSVNLSHVGIASKRLYVSSIFFHHRVASPFLFFHTKQDGNTPTGIP